KAGGLSRIAENYGNRRRAARPTYFTRSAIEYFASHQMKACSLLRLRLLGRFSVTRDGSDTLVNLPTKKTGALLAYLAMSKDFAASREELAALLWGGCTDQQARQSLRQALALLRKEIGADALVADTRMVRLDAARWSIDARDFAMLARASSADELARAAQLLSGDFLNGLNI